MRRQVHAVVVLRHRSDWLVPTLAGLAGQTHPVTSTVVVDLTGEPETETVVREHLRDTSPLTYLHHRSRAGFAEAVNLARRQLTTPEGEPVEAGWMWLLREDTEPETDALGHLFVAVDGAPSVVIAGPKQRSARQRNVLREFGETLTVWGERQAIVDRELDQAQYDRMSDVLSVGDAGMLVAVTAFDELGGFDPALDPLDAALDLGIRARLAGHRVLAVPAARTYVGSGPADWRAGKDLNAFTHYRLDRQAWLYRRFVYAPWWALLPLIVLALPLSLARALVSFVTKHPDLALADLLATLRALLSLPRVIPARERLHRAKTVGWGALRPLRMTPADRRRRRQLVEEERFAQLEETASLKSRPAFWPGGVWMALALAFLGALASGPLLSARALGGGGLLPLSPTLPELWSETRWLQPLSVDGVWGERLAPADPGAVLFALLGSLTWWDPSLSLVFLWATALPLAGVIAWWAGSQILAQSMPTTFFAVLWALSPTFLVALAEGRVGAVIAHLALPWLLATALTAHDSWQRAGQASFATAVVVAAAPVLGLAVVVGWLVILMTTGWRTPVRTLLGTLPLVLAPTLTWWLPRIEAATEGGLLAGLGRWFADPGVPLAYTPAPWWQNLAGWPTEPTLGWWGSVFPALSPSWLAGLGIPLIVLAVAVLATPRIDGMILLAALVPLGLIVAQAAPEITQGFAETGASGNSPLDHVAVWSGTGVSLAFLGVIVAAAITLDNLHPIGRFPGTSHTARRAGAWSLALLTLASLVLAGGGEVMRQWAGSSPVVALDEPRLVPALVAAEAPQNPGQGILSIQTAPSGTLRVSLLRGSGPRLDTVSAISRLRPAEGGPYADDLAFAAAALVRESGDDPADILNRLGISFILYAGSPESPEALAISRNPRLIPAGQTDDQSLWQVMDSSGSAVNPVAPSSTDTALDLAWWVALALAGVLALPTERRPRHRPDDRADEDSVGVVSEEADDDR